MVTVSGPCFDQHSDTSNVVCKIANIVTPAKVLDATRAQFILPMLTKTGVVHVAVSTDGGQHYNHAGNFTLGKDLSVSVRENKKTELTCVVFGECHKC